MSNYQLSRIATLVCSASLIACGGGGSGAPVQAQAAPIAASTTSVDAAVVVATGPDASAKKAAILPPTTGVPAPITGAIAITDIKLQSTGLVEQRSVPVTFGQPFAKGQLLPGQTLVGRLADGTNVALQVDNKATHADGSVRHAVISTIFPLLPAQTIQSMDLVTTTSAAPTAPVPPESLLAAGFSSTINIDLDGQRYTASAADLLRAGKYNTWLSGPIVNEWHVSAPLMTAQGVAHPHLMARYAIRAYRGNTRARVDVTIESGWDYVAGPQNFKYNAQIAVGGTNVYEKQDLVHYHHARWRKVFWWGATPQVHVRHNIGYLIGSKAVANYDQSITFPEATLAALKTGWTGAKTEPMGVGLANPYMPSTGGRDDIGLLPAWATTYLLTMDPRAKEVTLGTGDLSGSWGSHYRDKITDRPVSLVNYPAMTVLGHYGDTWNEAAKRFEQFPPCAVGADCTTPNIHDSSHQPNLAYLPYLVTGDYYYLEELQFWGMWNSYMENPGYRQYGKALLKADQVRGQAWALRSLVEAAYITPDADPLKAHFASFVDSNFDWYNTEYSNNPASNALGILTNGYALVYENGTGLSPWQDDFFTSAVGHAAELGFEKAKPLLAFKAKFPIARMTAPGACWIDAAIYALKVRSSPTGPIFTTMAEAYQATHTPEINQLACNSPEMAAAMNLKVGEMTGYAYSVVGYPSNMQPALAYAASTGGAAGATAWSVFNSRSVKPDHSIGAQFDIVPR